MGYQQWLRVLELEISGKGGSLSIKTRGAEDGLKVEFDVTRTIGSKQNTATIAIYNLTVSHRNMLGEEFDKVTLKVGYVGGETSIIFKGNIRDVKNTADDDASDVKSTLTCGDGDKAVNKGAVSKTHKKGTKPKKIIEDVVKEMPDVELGQLSEGIDDLPEIKRPHTTYGYAFRQLDELGRMYGFYWSIQNEKVQVVKHDKPLKETVVLSKDTGLIGIPTVTDKGVEAKALINPKLNPGSLVDIRSQFLDEESGRSKGKSDKGGGIFRLNKVRFHGTNRGDEFYAEFDGNRVSGGTVKK